MSSTRSRLLAGVVLAATFGAGILVGVFVAHLVQLQGMRGMRGLHEVRSGRLVDRLDRRLDLTDAQYTQIKAIVERRHERIMSITAGVRPAIHKEILETNGEIATVLTPEQRKEWDRIKMRLMPGPHGPGMMRFNAD